jgi:predicted DNA-binding protein with PD1-like motif
VEFKQLDKTCILRLDPGEEILDTLKNFCVQHGIAAGWVSGIGAVSRATIGYFNLEKKIYLKTEITEDHELTSLSGNISINEGNVFLHLHATLSDSECRVRGGHLFSGVISATGEIVLAGLAGTAERRFDERRGLRLLWFGE